MPDSQLLLDSSEKTAKGQKLSNHCLQYFVSCCLCHIFYINCAPLYSKLPTTMTCISGRAKVIINQESVLSNYEKEILLMEIHHYGDSVYHVMSQNNKRIFELTRSRHNFSGKRNTNIELFLSLTTTHVQKAINIMKLNFYSCFGNNMNPFSSK